MIAVIIGTVLVIIIIIIVVYIEYKVLSVNYEPSQIVVESEWKHTKNVMIPLYLSRDEYKDIQDINARNKRVFNDYFYLLDLAIKNYYECDIKNYKSCTSILIFAKYIVDYDIYIKATNYNSEFDAKYKNMKDILNIMNFINNVSIEYKNDKDGFNALIYGIKIQKQSCNNERIVYQEKPYIINKQFAVKKELTDYAIMSVKTRNKAILNDLKYYFKSAIESLISSKEQLYDIYINRSSDTEFLQFQNFAPVLQYAKFIEDNKYYLDQINPIDKTTVLKTLYPDFNHNLKFYVRELHIQTFIIIATNLYTTIPIEVDNVVLKHFKLLS